MFDQRFEEAATAWLEVFDRIRSGNLTDIERECYPNGVCEWACDEAPPDPKYYRPWRDEEATWFQLWETVSEGTPVSPPFETKEGLIDYLAENGDFWDQKRCHEPDWQTLWRGKPGISGWGKEKASRFVNGPGWAPTFVIEDGRIMDGVSALAAQKGGAA